MAETGTGLFRRKGKCAGTPRRISYIRTELVFRGAHEKCSHNGNEVSALSSELVFRQIPGKLVQRRGHSQRFRRRIGLHRALLDPVGGRVVRVPAAPTRLRLLPPRRLAFRFAAGALPLSYPRVRPKPSTTDRARSLPGLWHGDASSSPRRTARFAGFRSESVDHFWKAEVGHSSRVPKVEMQQSGRLQNDGGTENACRAHEKSAQACEDTIRGTKVGRTLSTTMEDQQLMAEQGGFGDNGTESARPCQSGQGDDHMNE